MEDMTIGELAETLKETRLSLHVRYLGWVWSAILSDTMGLVGIGTGGDLSSAVSNVIDNLKDRAKAKTNK